MSSSDIHGNDELWGRILPGLSFCVFESPDLYRCVGVMMYTVSTGHPANTWNISCLVFNALSTRAVR